MSEPRQYLKYPQDVTISMCCASCKHGKEAYGYEWFCEINKYKREVLGKNRIEEKGTEPYYLCHKYEMTGYIENEI